MTVATFCFHGVLNEFLRPDRRGNSFDVACARDATTKHMIEALGVPHTEVGLIFVNGAPSDFKRLIQYGDRIVVYPRRGASIESYSLAQPALLQPNRFFADSHFGGLARLLRMLGFDTRYENQIEDGALVSVANREGRVILTRDRELLKRRDVVRGCYVRAQTSKAQLREVVFRWELAGATKPFSLCLECNAPLHQIDVQEASSRVPEGVAGRFSHFATCDLCKRVFWEGSHWERMRELVSEMIDQKMYRLGRKED